MIINLYKLNSNYNGKKDGFEKAAKKIKDVLSDSKKEMLKEKNGVVSFRIKNSFIKNNISKEFIEKMGLQLPSDEDSIFEMKIKSFPYNSANSEDEEEVSWSFINKQINNETTETLDNEDEEIKKQIISPKSIFLINLNLNGECEEEIYAITFGHSYHYILDMVDSFYPFDFLNIFSSFGILNTNIIFPFSRTNKSMNSHDDLSDIHTRNGSYLTSIDLTIGDLPAVINEFLSGKRVISISNSISFPFKIYDKDKGKEDFKNLIELIFWIHIFYKSRTSSSQGKFKTLKKVGSSKVEEIKKSIFQDFSNSNSIETRMKIPGFTKLGDGAIYTALELQQLELDFTTNVTSQLFEQLEISDKVLFEMFDIFKDNKDKFGKKTFVDVLNNVQIKNDNGKHVGNIISLFDMVIEHKGKKYIYTDSNFYEPQEDFTKILVEGLVSINENTSMEDSGQSPIRLILQYIQSVRDIEDEEEKRESIELFGKYREIIFNCSYAFYLRNELKIESYLFDRKVTSKDKVEVADLVYKEDDKYVISHVKFGLENLDMSKNIDQSLTSLSLLKNKDEKYFKHLSDEIGKNIDEKEIGVIEMIFVVDSKELNKIKQNDEIKWESLDGRTISKLKMLEWKWNASSEGVEFRIKLIESKIKISKSIVSEMIKRINS